MSSGQIAGGNFFAPGQSTGQRLGGLVGGGIGFFASGGNPYAAYTGYQMGADISGVLDPVSDQHGPVTASNHLSEGSGQA